MSIIPNIVFLLYDQMSAVFPGNPEQIDKFKKEQLPNMTYLHENSYDFVNHYINTAACIPSRASIFTGLSPEITGIWNTDGVAKGPDEITWLDPDKFPTLGNHLLAAGYDREDVVYVGKFHLKNPKSTSLFHPDGRKKFTVTKDGQRVREHEYEYSEKDYLKEYGFTWIGGPDPHGPGMENMGWLLDAVYIDRAIEWLTNRTSDKPYVLVISLLEPHDVVYYERYWKLFGLPTYDDTIPKDLSEPDNPILEPTLKDYVQKYHKMFNQPPSPELYRRFYYYLMKISDQCLGKLLKHIDKNNTFLITTSDHGDALGINGVYQKWYNAQEATIHVPLTVTWFKHGVLVPGTKLTYLTSHLDIMPTILHLVGVEYNQTSLFHNDYDRELHFISKDHISSGSNQVQFVGRFFDLPGHDFSYEAVINPAGVEAWIQIKDGVVCKKVNYFPI